MKFPFRRNRDVNIAKVFSQLHLDFLRVESMRTYLAEHPCPKCQKKQTLHLTDYEVGETGWEAKLTCNGCRSQGIFNNSGFHMKMWNGEDRAITAKIRKTKR